MRIHTCDIWERIHAKNSSEVRPITRKRRTRALAKSVCSGKTGKGGKRERKR
jgi:hypothetical protein